MNLSGNTILITGGGSGIGLALAVRFLKEGSTVLICGRRADKLEEAKREYPGLHSYVCDVADPAARTRLAQQATQDFPGLNVLLNNAGIQQRMDLLNNTDDWSTVHGEIAINLEAPIHLSLLLLPHLQQGQSPAIINVSSGLAFIPPAFAPVYGATKAAIHSFTVSLRSQAEQGGIKVYELIPPAVNTDLGGPGLHTFGVNVDEFADAMMEGLRNDAEETGFGMSAKARMASRQELDEMTKGMNSR